MMVNKNSNIHKAKFSKWIGTMLGLIFLGIVFLLASLVKSSKIFSAMSEMFFVLYAICTLLFYKQKIKPIYELEDKLLEIYETLPETSKYTSSGKQILPIEILEDVIYYQEYLVNTELMSDYLIKESELTALQSQINPHFLFNTLESIRGCAYKSGMPELAEITEAMSCLFRYSIQKGTSLIALAEEIENIKNYMSIQQFRFRGKFEYILHIDDPILLNYQVPNMLLQPIVENSIFHGMETKIEKGRIDIYIQATERRLRIRVVDDGVGIAPNKLRRLQKQLEDTGSSSAWRKDPDSLDVGIGILNIHKRIQLKYGEEYGISLASTLNVGTEVEIIIPAMVE